MPGKVNALNGPSRASAEKHVRVFMMELYGDERVGGQCLCRTKRMEVALAFVLGLWDEAATTAATIPPPKSKRVRLCGDPGSEVASADGAA